MVRLIDVAKKAGVSHGTASNVFNNPDKVRPALRERVKEAAAAMGYGGPDPKGKLLRDGKFNAIAVMPPIDFGVCDAIANPLLNKFFQGVGKVCDAHGKNMLITPGALRGSDISGALVDGIIFSRPDQLEQIEAAIMRQIPFVVVDFDAGPAIGSVRVDARLGGYLAAKHLIDLGHRKFAIMSFLREVGPFRLHEPNSDRSLEAAGAQTDQEKYLGYRDAFDEVGLNIDDVPMVQAYAGDKLAPAYLLDHAPGATAVLSMAIMQAIGVVEEAQRRGISVPDELSVVGYNDIDEARTCNPGVTTIDTLAFEKGHRAAEMVLSGGSTAHVVLTPSLTVRRSSARPRV